MGEGLAGMRVESLISLHVRECVYVFSSPPTLFLSQKDCCELFFFFFFFFVANKDISFCSILWFYLTLLLVPLLLKPSIFPGWRRRQAGRVLAVVCEGDLGQSWWACTPLHWQEQDCGGSFLLLSSWEHSMAPLKAPLSHVQPELSPNTQQCFPLKYMFVVELIVTIIELKFIGIFLAPPPSCQMSPSVSVKCVGLRVGLPSPHEKTVLEF